MKPCRAALAVALCSLSSARAQEATIRIHADQPLHEVTRLMTGACIEDVNHEIYGGIYSQMIFGESFQEPSPALAIPGFKAYGGSWVVKDGELYAGPGDGPKLISNYLPFASGEVSVEVMFPDAKPGNAGLILKVAEPGVGADHFIGYEISLDPDRRLLVIGRHRHDWELQGTTPCKIERGKWISLSARTTETGFEVFVDGRSLLTYEDSQAFRTGAIGLRTWQRDARFRNLKITQGDETTPLNFALASPRWDEGVSGMWRGLRRGSANGVFSLVKEAPRHGTQSQRIAFESGNGEIGIENRGLNRWGMRFVKGKPYESRAWLKALRPTDVYVTLENGDGSQIIAESSFAVVGSEWKRFDFTLTPNAAIDGGRFAIKLKKPGTIDVGYAFLQPGEWGRFNGLPVRRDVAEGLVDQGVTVLRMGGLMANAVEYRWKKMIGRRDLRQPYMGYWYPHSTNGWGVIDFLDFCDAAGFVAIPDLNMDETPQDLADFVEYVNGSAESPWGKRRVQDGRKEPYRLKHLQLGNEEAVDEAYSKKFEPLAEAVWAKDPNLILIVGDFEYKRPIVDPFQVTGAPRIKTLAAHQKILDLAKSHGREVWFDVHIWNHHPGEALPSIAALKTFGDALEKLSPGAKFKLCVLEENAVNHAMRRAIAHAETINGLMRLGDRVKIVCAANCLQPDRQNDNGWDQGLLFLNPSKVWGQPSYYVTQMVSQAFKPKLLKTEAQSPGNVIDAVALADEQGRMTLQVVNRGANRVRSHIHIDGAKTAATKARVVQLAGSLDDSNTAADTQRIVPWEREWKLESKTGAAYVFPPYSVTVMRFDQ